MAREMDDPSCCNAWKMILTDTTSNMDVYSHHNGTITSTTNNNNNNYGQFHRIDQQASILSTSPVTVSNTNTNGASATTTKPEEVLIAQELNELTFQEREEVMNEIHGVHNMIQETPEFLNSCLYELEQALSKLSKQRRKNLDKAIFLKPSLEKDRPFRLMFLRADRYDARMAAQRLCSYFDHKVEIFGEEKLVKDITLEDLFDNEQDKQAFLTGTFQLLPQKDQSGRRILVSDLKNFQYTHWIHQTRYMWYQIMSFLEDENVQINGVVNVINAFGMEGRQESVLDFVTQGAKSVAQLPLRFSALHFGYDDPRLSLIMSVIQVTLGRHFRLRFRSHFGSDLEIKYALMAFGICIETQLDGRIPQEVLEKYYQDRLKIESERKHEEQASGIIAFPKPNDVLLGRGRPFQDFPGNHSLVKIEERYRERYKQATQKFEKTIISMEIIQHVKERGGRFLHRSADCWKLADDLLVREKISQAMRVKARHRVDDSVNNPPSISSSSSPSSSRDGPVICKRMRYSPDMDLK